MLQMALNYTNKTGLIICFCMLFILIFVQIRCLK
ncbi:unknown [Alistipes sp. CAG:53]|nr:unknown [Alistipes sp. CAG:53]